MGFFAQLLAGPADVARDPTQDRWWGSAPQASAAGVTVSANAAMGIAAFWACVKVIAEDLASLPLITYRRRADGGKDRDPDHPIYDLLHDQPNPWQSSFEWIAFMTASALVTGNGFSLIVPGPRGPVDQLIPLHPETVSATFDGQRISYQVRRPDGTQRSYLQDEIFHLPGLTLEGQGIFGVSVVRYARETLGLTLAAESHGARVFSQGATLGGVLSHPKRLSEDAARRIRADFEETHAGLGNAHRWAVLEEGMEAKPLSMTNEDAEFLATRAFQIVEICRWFRMQPHKIAHLEHATFSNIEHQALEHVTDTVMPWAKRWERAIKRQLILDKRRVFAEFLFDDLLRGDTLSRYQAYTAATGQPWMVVNEARRRENMNPIEGGDALIRPLNMAPAEAGATGRTGQDAAD